MLQSGKPRGSLLSQLSPGGDGGQERRGQGSEWSAAGHLDIQPLRGPSWDDLESLTALWRGRVGRRAAGDQLGGWGSRRLWGLGWPGPGSGQGGCDKQLGSGGLLRWEGGGCGISWRTGKTVGSRGFNTDSHVSRLAERTACYLPRRIRSRGRGGGSPGAPFVRRFVTLG